MFRSEVFSRGLLERQRAAERLMLRIASPSAFGIVPPRLASAPLPSGCHRAGLSRLPRRRRIGRSSGLEPYRFRDGNHPSCPLCRLRLALDPDPFPLAGRELGIRHRGHLILAVETLAHAAFGFFEMVAR